MYPRILWMTDLSRRADACLAPVRLLARISDAEVIIAHATGRPVGSDPVPAGAPARGIDPNEAHLPQARAHLDGLAARLRQDGVRCSTEIDVGRAERVAAILVERHGVDLVVGGRTGVSGLDRLLVGSTASRFLRHLPVPVLVVGRRAFDRLDALLCPVDPDGDDRPAGIAHASRLARATGATVTFLAVLDGKARPDDAIATECRVRTLVEEVLGEPVPPGWRTRAVIDSSPASGILHAAQTHDIVTMSSAGRGGFERFLGGSLAHDVVRDCVVSVLVAR